MAAIPVTIVGKTADGNDITIVGLMSWTGMGVGGGPIIPAPPTQPPGYPAFPIAPPVYPPGNYPSHPIYWPGYPPGWGSFPPIVQPPPGGGGGDGPTLPLIEWKVAWSPETGWVVVGLPTGPHPTPSGAPPAGE